MALLLPISLFLVGAPDLLILWLFLEFLSLCEIIAYSNKSNHSRTLLIQNYNFNLHIITSSIFLLGMILFYGATGGFKLSEYEVFDYKMFSFATGIFMLAFLMRGGFLPWFNIAIDKTSLKNIDLGLLLRPLVGFRSIIFYISFVCLQNFIVKLSQISDNFYALFSWIIFLSASFILCYICLSTRNYHKILIASLFSVQAFYFTNISLLEKIDEGQLVFFICQVSLLFTGILFSLYSRQMISVGHRRLKGFANIIIVLFALVLLSPMPSGVFFSKYLLLRNYIEMGNFLFVGGWIIFFIMSMLAFKKLVLLVFDEWKKDMLISCSSNETTCMQSNLDVCRIGFSLFLLILNVLSGFINPMDGF
ncbi:MAG: hypothetical protein HQK52_00900 [Oligoflexia bacterium]|nr:hypothetical protein [Oligoflexia bacterium]